MCGDGLKNAKDPIRIFLSVRRATTMLRCSSFPAFQSSINRASRTFEASCKYVVIKQGVMPPRRGKRQKIAPGGTDATSATPTFDSLPLASIVECMEAFEAAKLSLTSKALNAKGGTIDVVMRSRLQKSELGKSLLRRHHNEFRLAKLAHCVEYCPAVGAFLTVDNLGDPSVMARLRNDDQHPANVATEGDLYQARDIQMAWVRVHFVIDGVAVIERVEKDIAFDRYPIVRLSLPYLLDLLQPGHGLTNQPHPFEDDAKVSWREGMAPYFMSDTDESVSDNS